MSDDWFDSHNYGNYADEINLSLGTHNAMYDANYGAFGFLEIDPAFNTDDAECPTVSNPVNNNRILAGDELLQSSTEGNDLLKNGSLHSQFLHPIVGENKLAGESTTPACDILLESTIVRSKPQQQELISPAAIQLDTRCLSNTYPKCTANCGRDVGNKMICVAMINIGQLEYDPSRYREKCRLRIQFRRRRLVYELGWNNDNSRIIEVPFDTIVDLTPNDRTLIVTVCQSPMFKTRKIANKALRRPHVRIDEDYEYVQDFSSGIISSASVHKILLARQLALELLRSFLRADERFALMLAHLFDGLDGRAAKDGQGGAGGGVARADGGSRGPKGDGVGPDARSGRTVVAPAAPPLRAPSPGALFVPYHARPLSLASTPAARAFLHPASLAFPPPPAFVHSLYAPALFAPPPLTPLPFDSRPPLKLPTPVGFGCNCDAICNALTCVCRFRGRPCGEHCLCVVCDVKLTVDNFFRLHSQDPCFWDNLVDLRRDQQFPQCLLNNPVRFECCQQSSVLFRVIRPDTTLIFCPNCNMPYRYSWCKVCLCPPTGQFTFYHCALCGICHGIGECPGVQAVGRASGEMAAVLPLSMGTRAASVCSMSASVGPTVLSTSRVAAASPIDLTVSPAALEDRLEQPECGGGELGLPADSVTPANSVTSVLSCDSGISAGVSPGALAEKPRSHAARGTAQLPLAGRKRAASGHPLHEHFPLTASLLD